MGQYTNSDSEAFKREPWIFRVIVDVCLFHCYIIHIILVSVKRFITKEYISWRIFGTSHIKCMCILWGSFQGTKLLEHVWCGENIPFLYDEKEKPNQILFWTAASIYENFKAFTKFCDMGQTTLANLVLQIYTMEESSMYVSMCVFSALSYAFCLRFGFFI